MLTDDQAEQIAARLREVVARLDSPAEGVPLAVLSDALAGPLRDIADELGLDFNELLHAMIRWYAQRELRILSN